LSDWRQYDAFACSSRTAPWCCRACTPPATGWSKGWHVRYWLAPLEVTCEEIASAGFLIERLREPRPAPQAAAIDPEDYERLCREPVGFLAFRLRPAP
jgi:hypothetical protein